MITDLITLANYRAKQMMDEASRKWRTRRRPRPMPLTDLVLISLFLLSAILCSSATCEHHHHHQQQQQQQQPSQLFLPNNQKGPISLVPRVNQKRLEEEVDGFIMQAQQNNHSLPNLATGSARSFGGSSEQAVTFETTTAAAVSGLASQTNLASASDDEQYRIPIDANRQQFVTHDQLKFNVSGHDNDSGEPKIQQAPSPESGSSLDGGETTPSSDHRGQQQWLRTASKISHVSSLISVDTVSPGDDSISSYIDRGTAVETSAPLSFNPTESAATSSSPPDDMQQDKTLPSNETLTAKNGTILQEFAQNKPVSDQLGESNGRQSDGTGSANIRSSLYFLSSGNGSASVANSLADSDRQLVEDSNGPETTTLAPVQKQQQPVSADDQQTATKRVASHSDSSDLASNGSSEDQQVNCSGYCTLSLFTMLCDSSHKSQDCGPSQTCCIIADKSIESSSEQQTTSASTTMSPENTDQLQQNLFIEQASRPQSASQVCRGACLPMYHSSLCMKPNEIQLDSPGCLPSFVCCSVPPSRQSESSDVDQSDSAETVAASPSDHMISHTSYPEHPSADGSLAAALVPPPPPMPPGSSSSLSAASQSHSTGVDQHPTETDQQMLRQPIYSIKPTARPLVQQATTKSTSNTSPSSPAANFMSQLYQIFKSASNSANKQPPRQQRQPPVQVPAISGVQPVAQASFLSHLFSDPYQALYGSSSSRPSGSPPAPSNNNNHNMIQQQKIISSNNYGPFVIEPQLQSHLSANNNKNRYPFMADSQQNVLLLSSSNKQNNFNGNNNNNYNAKFRGSQMMVPVSENNQVIVSQQMPSDQELLYLQQQMYLQQFNKQNGFSLAPNQQQRFHSPVVVGQLTDNTHPATFLLANQKPSLNSASPATMNTSQMKVVQQASPSPQLLANAPIVSTNSKQQVVKVDQIPAAVPFVSAVRPVTAPPSNGRQQVRPNQQPLEQKGFVGLATRQQDQAMEHQKTTIMRQQQQGFKPTTTNDETPIRANQVAVRLPPGSSNRTQPSRVSSFNNESTRPTVVNSIGQKKSSVHKDAQQASDETLPPLASQLTSMSSSSSNMNVHFSNGPHYLAAPPNIQRISDPLQYQHQQQPLKEGQYAPQIVGLLHNQRKPINLQRPAHDESDGEPVIPVEASDVMECPNSCMKASIAYNCVRPNYLDDSFACPATGSVCCVRVGNQSSSSESLPEPKRQPQASPAGTFFDGNKLDYPVTSQVDSGDDLMTVQTDTPIDPTGKPFSIATPDDESASNSSPATGSASRTKTRVQTCGVPNSSGGRRNSGHAKARIMGGTDAQPGYWCWQAALMNDKNEYLCGGALIGARWVLTAAHCITQHLRNESQLFVRLGQHNLNNNGSSAKGARSIQVKTSYVHHNHNGDRLDNDVALLRLEESVDLDADDGQGICLVCLPERNLQPMEPGKRCVVTGYGFENESGPAALRVRQTELPVVGDQECINKASSALNRTFNLPASSFCAGGEQGQDACHGDGGSPLSCLVDGFYELTGIVSWGYKCGSKDLPGLYSKVSVFVGWINQIVSANN